MDALVTAAASGMKARIESLEMLANNLANLNSPGYKTDREFYTTYLAAEAADEGETTPMPPVSPLIERHWTDFSQGAVVQTGNPTDFALQGPGMFRVAGPEGPLYTRSGNFRLSPRGAIETQQGFAVLDTDGKPLTVDAAKPFQVNTAGEIRQGTAVVGRFAVMEFPDSAGLAKRAGTYFTGPGGQLATRTAVYQGRLESSNQPPAEAAVKLIGVLRHFEMLQKAIQIGSEMSRRADEIARSGA